VNYQLPDIVKASERMLAQIELAVRGFTRYHKYAHGAWLRGQAMQVALSAHRAWRDRAHQPERIEQLSEAIDGLKVGLQLGKDIQCFASFAQFEMLARLAADLGRQCGGWRKQRRRNGQNAAEPSAPSQRAEILSSRAASVEARP
jgi:hypothetical protein